MKLQTLEILCRNDDRYAICGDDVIQFEPSKGKTLLRLNNKNYKLLRYNGHDDRTPTFSLRMKKWEDIEMLFLYYDNGGCCRYEFDNLFQRAAVCQDNIVVEIFH